MDFNEKQVVIRYYTLKDAISSFGGVLSSLWFIMTILTPLFLFFYLYEISGLFKSKVTKIQYITRILKFLKRTHDIFGKVQTEGILDPDDELFWHIEYQNSKIYDHSVYVKSKYKSKNQFIYEIQYRDLEKLERIKDQVSNLIQKIGQKDDEYQELKNLIFPLWRELRLIKYLKKRK